MSGAIARPERELPPWLRPFDRLIERAAGAVRLLSSAAPVAPERERARLADRLAAGASEMPSWSYAPVQHDELRRALQRAQDALEGRREEPLVALYVNRLRELDLEAELCAVAGTRAVARVAVERFAARDAATAAAASALCARWLDEPRARETGPCRASDDGDPRSLLSRMRRAVGEARLPFAVAVHPSLASLAATGSRFILVAGGRQVTDEDAVRTVLHEVEGHARPRARAPEAATALFQAATARGVDDQEGRALILEDRAGLLGPRRRRQLALRHLAVEAMLSGATFADLTRELVAAHGVEPADAVLVAERVFRGSDGTHPGLGRERVYVQSFLKVSAHLAGHADEERVMACGQVAVDTLAVLAPYAPPRR